MQRDPDARQQADLERDPGAPAPPETGMPTPIQESTPPHDAWLLPLVHQLIQPYVQAARAHGPIPPLRSDEWLDAHPDQQIAHLLIIGMGTVLADPHAVIRHVLKQTSVDVHQAGLDHGGNVYWQRTAMQHRRNIAEVEQRRAEQLPARCDTCHGHLHTGVGHQCQRRTA